MTHKGMIDHNFMNAAHSKHCENKRIRRRKEYKFLQEFDPIEQLDWNFQCEEHGPNCKNIPRDEAAKKEFLRKLTESRNMNMASNAPFSSLHSTQKKKKKAADKSSDSDEDKGNKAGKRICGNCEKLEPTRKAFKKCQK